MENIINVPFKRKNTVDSDIFVPDRIEGDFIIFKNNARCSVEKFQSEFEPSDNAIQLTTEDLNINPDTFFEQTVSNDALIEQIIQNPNSIPSVSQNLKESKPIDENIPNAQLIDRINGDESYDKNIRPSNQEYPEQEVVKKENRLPEWDTFDRVKKTEEIEIHVPFKIKLPKANQLSMLNDMFETSFTGYLAKQYIKDNIVNNSIALQKLLQSSIEEWIENELDGISSKKRKTKKPIKQEKVKEIIKENKESEHEVEQEENAMAFFGMKQPVWDGDIKKLFAIQSQDQYDAIKKAVERLKENNPDSIDIDKYEDMISIYEEQINTEPTQ